MSGVLLMACAGPMQSWGTRSRFEVRDTEREPSKSGIIGLLASALGRFREDPVDDLAALRMGVRVDREGVMQNDFQTVQKVAVASGGTPVNQVSHRHYLSDAVFLVGLEGETAFLSQLHAALKNPKRPLFLGRKSYVPGLPIYLPEGLMIQRSLEVALEMFPFLPERVTRSEKNMKEVACRFVVESDERTFEIRKDQPVSFKIGNRLYMDRYVKMFHKNVPVERVTTCI